MARDLGLADRLRAAGLNVVEVAGWQTRGSDLHGDTKNDKVVVVRHHTAGPRQGNAPSLNICTYGRSDLPGPLCNVLQGRDGTAYVISSARANHAGSGSWKGVTGNYRTMGIEVESVGTSAEPWTDAQLEVTAKISAVMQEFSANPDADNCCEHREWAGPRKPDRHSVDGDTERNRTAQYIGEDDMPLNDTDKAWLLARVVEMGGNRIATSGTMNGTGQVDERSELWIRNREGIIILRALRDGLIEKAVKDALADTSVAGASADDTANAVIRKLGELAQQLDE